MHLGIPNRSAFYAGHDNKTVHHCNEVAWGVIFSVEKKFFSKGKKYNCVNTVPPPHWREQLEIPTLEPRP